jgi:hypothetical protein
VPDPAIVVAFRMAPGGLRGAPAADALEAAEPAVDASYLERARALCSRAEALGARLVAWSASSLAVAWDPDSIEEAIALATAIREGAASPAHAWACGIAEGTLEAFDPAAAGGARVALSWGEALVAAVALARAAQSGEVLVDGDVRAIRAGQLAIDGMGSATDGGERIRGWRLNIEQPWREMETGLDADSFDDEATSYEVLRIIDDAVAEVSDADIEDVPDDGESTTVTIPVNVAAESGAEAARASHAPPSIFAARLRQATIAGAVGQAVELLPELRRTAAAARRGAAGRAHFELAAALALAGRRDDALLEALAALARARESGDTRLGAACLALLAKLYARAGWPDAGKRLAELALASGGSGS